MSAAAATKGKRTPEAPAHVPSAHVPSAHLPTPRASSARASTERASSARASTERASTAQATGAHAKAARVPAAARAVVKASYHHGDLRTALVDAAARLAAEVGPAAVTLREAARRAGVSQAAPYHHFADKAALMAAVAEEGFRLFDAHQAAALEAAPASPIERLSALGVSYVRFALRYPQFFRVMFRPYLFDGPRTTAFEAAAERAFVRLVDVTRAAREAAGHRDADVVAAAMAMWAVPHGMAGLALDTGNGPSLTPAGMEALVCAATLAMATHMALTDLPPHPDLCPPLSAAATLRALRESR